MRFEQPLRQAWLVRRYKRFLADVADAAGCEWTVHCPNTGSMLGCQAPGSRVWLSYSPRRGRKYAYTWELVEVDGGVLVGVHTGRANALVAEAIDTGCLPGLAGYEGRQQEVSVPDAPMRADWMLTGRKEDTPRCLVEVKNVTAAVEGGEAFFPDAVTERGRRHLGVLAQWVAEGGRAVVVYCVQRTDAEVVRPAEGIDPRYAEALRAASAAGVEVVAIRAQPSPYGIVPEQALSIRYEEERERVPTR